MYTDPIVFYPIGWAGTMDAATKPDYSKRTLAHIRSHSWTVHIYTQMYKLANKPFSYESDSLLGMLIDGSGEEEDHHHHHHHAGRELGSAATKQ